MKAKKFIESKTEGEYEIKKFHVINIDIEKKKLDEVVDYFDLREDYEESSLRFGVGFDWDEEIYSIEIEKFIHAIYDWMEGDEMPEYFISVLSKLEKYKEYTLYP